MTPYTREPDQTYPRTLGRDDDPYNAQSHTFLSPGGMNYPAPTGPHRSVSDPNHQLRTSHPLPPFLSSNSMPSPASPWPAAPLHLERRHSTDRNRLGHGHDTPPNLPTARAPSYSPSPSIGNHPASFPNPPLRPLSTADLPETSRSASPAGSASSAPAWRGAPRVRKGRTGGPPKAKLGGPGGKTFDEMLAAGEVQERKVSPSSISPQPHSALAAKNNGDLPSEKEAEHQLLSEGTAARGTTEDRAHYNEGVSADASASGSHRNNPGSAASPKSSERQTLADQHVTELIAPGDEPLEATSANDKVDKGPEGAGHGHSEGALPPATPGSEGSDLLSFGADETDNPWEAPLEGTLAGFEDLVGAGKSAKWVDDSKPSISGAQDSVVPPGQKEHLKPKIKGDGLTIVTGAASDHTDQPNAGPLSMKSRGLASLPRRPDLSPPTDASSSGKHSTTSPKASKRGKDGQPPGDHPTPGLPNHTKHKEMGVPEPRAARGVGMANNAFFRKSLGGMLKGSKEIEERKAVRRSRQSDASVSSVVSDSVAGANQSGTMASGEDEEEIADNAGAVGSVAKPSPSSSLETVQLNTPTQTSDDALGEHGSGDDGAALNASVRTITPAKSKRIGPSLQKEFQGGEETVGQQATRAAGPMGGLFVSPTQPADKGQEAQFEGPKKRASDTPSSQPPGVLASPSPGGPELAATQDPTLDGEVAKLRTPETSQQHSQPVRPPTPNPGTKDSAEEEKHLPIKRPGSGAGSADQSARLGPDANAVLPSSDGQQSRSLSGPSTRPGDFLDDRNQKRRAKLRPSAAAFVPRPASTRRHLPSGHAAPAVSAGGGNASELFSFAPLLPTILPIGLQPSVPHFPHPFVFGQNVPGPMRSVQVAFNRPPHVPAGVPGYIPPSQILLGQARHPLAARPLVPHPADFTPGPRIRGGPAPFGPSNLGGSQPSLSNDTSRSSMVGSTLPTGIWPDKSELPELQRRENSPLRTTSSVPPLSLREKSSHVDNYPLSALDEPTTNKPLSPSNLTLDLPPLPSDTPSLGPPSRPSEYGGERFMISLDSSDTIPDHYAQSPAQMSVSSPDHTRDLDHGVTADDSPRPPRHLTPRLSPLRFPSDLHLRPGGSVSPRLIPQSPSPMLLDDQLTARPNHSQAVFATPEIKIDPAANDRRFREWVFPAGGERRSPPSISRRHTMPTELQGLSEPSFVGIASTFSTRVDGLRQMLSKGSLGDVNREGEGVDADESSVESTMARRKISTQSSIEFPLRRERKTLTVVNSTPGGDESPGASRQSESPASLDLDARIDVVLQTLRRIELGVQEARPREGLGATFDHSVMEKIEHIFEQTRNKTVVHSPSSDTTLRELTKRLERHSSLLEGFTATAVARSHQETLSEDYDRTKDILEAVAEGQRGIIDQLAKSFESLESGPSSQIRNLLEGLRATQNETAEVLLSLHAAQPEVDELRRQLEEANSAFNRAQLEHENVRTRLTALAAENRDMHEEKEDIENKLIALEAKEVELRREADALLAGRTAAEQERDALSDALRAGMAETERLNEDVERTRAELASHKEQAAVEAEKSKTFEAISTATAAFQEEILSRMARLDEGMHETMGSRVKEYEAVLDRNKVLQSELDSLRGKLEATAAKVATEKTERERDASKHNMAIAALESKLQTEARSREESDRRVEALEKELEKARGERENALLVANERASWARMSEVRIQAMAQECVYWRQFALESDRRKYRAYMAANPFRGPGQGEGEGARPMPKDSDLEHTANGGSDTSASPPNARLTTPKQTPPGTEGKAEAPQTASPPITHGPTDPLMASLSLIVGDGEVKAREENEEGRLWDAA